jgi:hypothetical protein
MYFYLRVKNFIVIENGAFREFLKMERFVALGNVK